MFKKAKSLFSFVKEKLVKTRESITRSVTQVFVDTVATNVNRKKVVIDDNTVNELQEALILSDVSFNSSERIIKKFKDGLKNQETEEEVNNEFFLGILQKEISAMLDRDDLNINFEPGGLSVFIISGVNGSGKTTTIGKLANLIVSEIGKKVMIVAADTFRAAAISQLEVWAKRVGVEFFSNESKDPSSVVYSAIEEAEKKDVEVIIIDTAGRLGTNNDLMMELSKIENVIKKQMGKGPIENLLVLDGTSGQNALSQIEKFKKSINLTGIVITKLDSTSKAGFAISASYDYDLPIKLIGVGETLHDLLPFVPDDFSKALFDLK
ncbi:MAG TPA: signal recognition particle-docking protein FtsY [Candidatus Dadabacteria bacterium]|jgi:fused signal recognition particle receptor|nr:signal recognition particle-docking protein FtsY [Candidatus Dadabacteria bacterium]